LIFGEAKMIGSSPELLVRCEDNVVEVRPIAGTRPRGRNEKEDNILEKELLMDVKREGRACDAGRSGEE